MGQPTLVVQVEFASGALDSPLTWTPITSYVRGLSLKRGRQHELGRTAAGELTLRLANTDRRFDPANSAGPYYPNVVPMRRIRMRATHLSQNYDQFVGYVVDWDQAWRPRPIGSVGDAECVVKAFDGFSLLALTELKAYSAEVLEDGPLAYWRMDELAGTATAIDEGSLGQDGTYTGGVSLDQTGPLYGGAGAPAFDGTDDYVSVGVITELLLTGDLTLEAWIRRESPLTDGDAQQPIISGGRKEGLLPFLLRSATDRIEFQQTWKGGYSQVVATPAATIVAQTWHHVVVTRRAGLITIYVDGVVTATGPSPATPGTDADSRVDVGQDNATTLNQFKGRIAHAAIYDHALDPERIAAHYGARFDRFREQLSGAHLNAILDAVGWPTGDRTVDTGSSTIQRMTPSGTALEHLLAVAEDTEMGLLQIAGDGKLVFHERHALLKAPHTTVQAVLGDGETQPDALSGLILWLKADAITGLDDGNPVGTWEDSSAQNNDASATGTKRPVYRRSRYQGLPVVEFDGVNDRLALATNITGTAFTVFAVLTKAAAGAGDDVFFHSDDFTVLGRITALDRWHVRVTGADHDSSAALGTTPVVIAMVARSYNDVDLVTNQSVVTRSGGTGWASAGASGIGDTAAGGSAWGGELAELVIFSRALSGAERKQIESYLGRKWGVMAVTPYELPYHGLRVANDDQDLFARARVERAGGVAQVVEDATAKAKYGPRILERSGLLLHSDAAARGAAEYLLSRYKTPQARVREVVMLGGLSDPIFTQLLERSTHADRVNVRRRPPGGGSIFEQESHIEGVEHVVTPGKSWQTTWQLVPADPLKYWLLGDSTHGVLGTSARLGY